ncbi:DUF3093 domain-containing protein [Microbacterium sp. SORGH_AS_0888]|uniref:DUF3093 domain-containing protein n=1 Tax=Microbacterium sp. SORGH_AS_0888 TaxID=3041791 RepID=UPI00278005D3|nr:DUF3093 domain-containing protein [Microbacterium sp. SORGH_AS_0888]MDQ1128576.1 hypothetical protein [Microbacterium sp. SORGH_AS_0888]
MSSSASPSDYRERLTPSLWTIVAAAVCAPMAILVFVPAGAVLALVVGVLVAIAIVSLLLGLAPRVSVSGSTLRAGRAHIDVSFLGEPTALTGDEARALRGPGLPVRSWHLLRGGIDGVVVVPVLDSDDPTPAWVISSRTPDRLAAAVRRAQLRLRTPSR